MGFKGKKHKHFKGQKLQESVEQLRGPITWPSNYWVFLLKRMSTRWLTVPAVSRISSIHCWPSTSTCCKRERKGQNQTRGHWLRWCEALFSGQQAQVSRRRAGTFQWQTGDERKTDKQINGERGRQSRQKVPTRSMDVKRVNLQGSGWPAAPPTLRGHSPFCTSLLLSGRTFPQRSPEQTEPSVRSRQRQQAGRHRIRSAAEEQEENTSLSLMLQVASLWWFHKHTSHMHTSKTSRWGLCYTAGLQSSPDEVLRSKYVSLPSLGGD